MSFYFVSNGSFLYADFVVFFSFLQLLGIREDDQDQDQALEGFTQPLRLLGSLHRMA